MTEALCPYCEELLKPKPRRKKKCPHCGNYVYVHKGDLLTGPQKEARDAGRTTEGFDRWERLGAFREFCKHRWWWISPLLTIGALLGAGMAFSNDVFDLVERAKEVHRVPPRTLTRPANLHCNHRSDGDTENHEGDGATLVYVSNGDFIMGASLNDALARNQERPEHKVRLDEFWIYQHEVTNAQYDRCVEAGYCEEARCLGGLPQLDHRDQPDLPVTCVSWVMAGEYAKWVGGRLPTEAEWEKAARGDKKGDEKRIYPWGNTELLPDNGKPDCTKAAFNECVKSPRVVGSYPDGASPYGVLDMAGNVSEWTGDRFSGKYYAITPVPDNPQGPREGDDGAKHGRILRGGAYDQGQEELRCSSRRATLPGDRRGNIGFRVVVPCGLAQP